MIAKHAEHYTHTYRLPFRYLAPYERANPPMTLHIGVGDPAASSLSSCLCSFPGGFSLLTETGQLRPYLVSDTWHAECPPKLPEVVAAAPVDLSPPPQQGLFPVDRDVPVDHAWSRDGRVLVVLRRASFTAFWRSAAACGTAAVASALGGYRDQARDRSSPPAALRDVAPSLGLSQLHTGRNGFFGKVIACCLLGAAAGDAASPTSTAQCGARSTYVIAVGGSFGIECHLLEAPSEPRIDGNAPASRGGQQGPPSTERGNASPVCGSEESCKGRREEASASETAGNPPTAASTVTKAHGATATCRPATSLFDGYRVVAIAFSPDSRLIAAAAMTGHVKVWDVGLIAAKSLPPPAPRDTRKMSAGRAHGTSGEGSDDALREMKAPRRRDGALWSVPLPMARATSISFSPDDNLSFALACWDGNVALFRLAAAASPSPDQTSDNRARSPPISCDNGSGGNGADRREWELSWREISAPVKIGGGKGGSLEDQDGTFLCWCKGNDRGSPAGLAVSTYRAETDRGAHAADNAPEVVGQSHESESDAARGAGFDVFAEGLGDRVGGAVSGPRPASATEATAERYLIHGLAAGPSFVALYDSDMCLHIASLAALLGAGGVLPSPAGRTATVDVASELRRARVSRTEETVRPAVASLEPSSPRTAKVTLVNNDHGLIAAEAWRDRGTGLGGVDGDNPEGLGSEGLGISITWRNPVTGMETPDDGKCIGESGRKTGCLPFLPPYLAVDQGGEGGGVFGADIRWGRFALLTRYTVLVFARAHERYGADSGGEAAQVGGWRSYPHFPLVHGVLLGGASTAAPLSKSIPKAPVDLVGLYLLAVLETDEGGNAPVVSIRALRDRDATCRCLLIGMGEEVHGARVYVSPGYGGGVFVVAADGGGGTCAKIWRGTFDEGACSLELSLPIVVTSSPWPEPETLRLAGVAGPNCELVLFKEVGASRSGKSADNEGVRWWITSTEAGIWRCVDAPAMLGGEELGVCDFVKIFQAEVEGVMMSWSQGNAPLPSSERGKDGE